MELSSAGEGYNSDYSLMAGNGINTTSYYQEMTEAYEMTDIKNAAIEFWSKNEGYNNWCYIQVNHGYGWEGSWSMLIVYQTSLWTSYSYDLTAFLNNYGVSEGDDIRFRLNFYGVSWGPTYIDDISITGIGGVSEAVLDTSYIHTLAPGESTDINISYIVPEISGGELAGGFEFTSNDPVNESGQYPISIFVNFY